MDIDFDFLSYGDEYEDDIQNLELSETLTGSYIPNHLSSPITNDECLFLLNHQKFFCRRHIKLKEKLNKYKITQHIYETCLDPYICLLNFIKNESTDTYEYNKDLLSALITNSITSLKIHQINYNENSITAMDIMSMNNNSNQIKEELLSHIDDLLPHFILMRKVESIKEKLCLSRISYGDLLHHRDIEIDRDMFILECRDHGYTIGPTNLLLCVLDIYQSRFTIIFYSYLADINRKYNKYNMVSSLKEIINTFEFLRTKLSNDVYKFIALWESLIIGYTINDSINDLGFNELFDTSKGEMDDILLAHNVNINWGSILPKSRDKDEIKLFLELTGCSKNFGHPCLDVCEGFNNVREYGTEKAYIDMDVARITKSIFIRDFITEYYHKKRKWPPLIEIDDSLKEFYVKNIYPPKKFHLDYKKWYNIKFDKIFDYDYSPDTSELLKDTAAAPEYDQWFAPYDNCAFRLLYNKPKPKLATQPKPTRVIERYLIGDEYETLRKIHEVDNLFYDQKDLVATLCRKEQELKPMGRLFVKQTYEQRLLQTSMESNIANQVMKYIPEQTMTDGELQQMRRLAETATHQGDLLEIFNLDLSKWNLRFRHGLTYKIGSTIDEMFGLKNLYKDNHLWFIMAKVFINSRLCPPDYDKDEKPVPGPFFYDNHLGGMEGMRQKLWTIVTITLIKFAAESLNLLIDIMCQGDNQVVMIRYKPHQIKQKSEIRESFLTGLEKTLNKVNLKLKREETWFSIKLCEFGKIRYFEGEAVSAMLKKGARLIPDINDGVCSILSSLSTINTVTEAMAKYDNTPDVSFLINQFHILNFLHRKRIINLPDSDETWLQYLYHPTEFGGITLSTYFSHFVRGYDDKVPLWISIFRTIQNIHPSLFKKVISINQLEPNLGTKKISRLIEDIFSLNVRYLPSIEQTFKNLAESHLKSKHVTNPEITKLFKEELTLSNDLLVSRLTTMKPMILSVAHELLRNSNAGIVLTLRNRFTNIQTINKIVQKKYRRDFLDMMKLNNNTIIRILVKRKKNIESYYSIKIFDNYSCPTQIAQQLRRDHWGLEMVGDTKSYPCHQTYIKPIDNCSREELQHSVVIQLSNDYSTRYSNQYLTDGPFTAYMGSATREKVKKPTLDISVKTSYTKSLQQLYLMKSWFKRLGCVNLITLVEDLIKEKGTTVFEEDFDIDVEDWCATNYGGNILHRFKAMIERNTAVLNFLPTTASHIKQSTNYLASITSGGRDFTIHFQLILLLNIARLIKIKELKYQGISQFASVFCCSQCTQEITTVKFDIEDIVGKIGQEISIVDHTIITEISYSNVELQVYLSIYLGRCFGIIGDNYFNRIYLETKATISIRTIPQMETISLNDFRYVLWDFFIVGLIQGSKALRSILYKLDLFDQAFSKNKMFETLSLYLINCNMLQDFLIFTGCKAQEHYQVIQPSKACEIVFLGIVHHYYNNKNQVLGNFLNIGFRNDRDEFIKSKVNWTIQMLNKETGHYKISVKYYKQLMKTRSIRRKLFLLNEFLKPSNKFNLLYRLNSIHEDEILSNFRKCNKLNLKKNNVQFVVPIKCLQIRSSLSEKSANYSSFFTNLIQNVSQGFDFPNLHHLSRQFGNISTGVSKIIEIIAFFSFDKIKISEFFCLAEGSGSIYEGLNIIFPKARSYYNTLLIPEVDNRLGPDQNYAPALVNSSILRLTDFLTLDRLVLGNTNIMDISFQNKLRSLLILKNAKTKRILTIDAESSSGNSNFDILDYYVPFIFENQISIGIIKYFHHDVLSPNYNDSNYQCFSFKPITSNPNNRELYYIMIHNKIINNTMSQSIEIARQLLQYHSFIFETKTLSSISSINKYLSTLNWLIPELKSNYPNIPFPADFITELSGSELTCGVYCPNLIIIIEKLIKKVDRMSPEQPELFIIIRESGLIKTLERLIKLYFILKIINTWKEKPNLIRIIIDIYSVTLNIELEGLTSPEEQKLYTILDIKCILRRLLRDKNHCTCKERMDEEFYRKEDGLVYRLRSIDYSDYI